MPHNGILESGYDRTRSGRGTDREFEHPLLPGFDDLLKAGDPAFHLTHLLRLLLTGLGGRAARILSLSGALRIALRTPWLDHSR